jgi:hypothetical protein
MKTLLAGVILTGCVNASGSVVSHSSKRMADGKQWSTTNLNVNVAPPIDIKMTNRTGVSGTNGSEVSEFFMKSGSGKIHRYLNTSAHSSK